METQLIQRPIEHIKGQVDAMSDTQVFRYFDEVKSKSPDGYADLRQRLIELVGAGEIMLPPLNGYVCFFGHARCEVWADTTSGAIQAAAKKLNVPVKRQYQISARLCIRADGSEVTHVAD